MLGLESRNHGSALATWGDDLKQRAGRAHREETGGSPAGLLIAGAVIVGLGYLAWTYLGPDLKRYMKIHSM